MHELGVVFYVIKDVKAVAAENGISRVHSVTLEIGEVSGVVHELLRDCWNWAVKKEEILEGAALRIEEIKAFTRCMDCGQLYETVRYAKVCPHCQSENTCLQQGNEFNIKEIEVYDDGGPEDADETEGENEGEKKTEQKRK